MPDTPMSPVQIEHGLGQLLATQHGLGASADPEEVADTEEVTDAGDELGLEAEDSEAVDDAEDEGDDEAAATDEPEFALDLKVNGEEHRITDRAEAIKLAQLGMHFTQRNEAVIQRERQADERIAEANRARDQYAAYLPEIEAYLANPLGERPKRDAYQDELSYLKADKQWAEAQENVQAARAERQRVEQEQAQERQQALQRWARDQDQALLAELPEWHDRQVRQQETQKMLAYAREMGISDAALQNPLLVCDKSFVMILRDAMRYRQVTEKGATAVEKVRTTEAAPGPAKRGDGATVSRRRKEIESRASSGKIDDIAPGMGQVMGRILELQHSSNNRTRKR